MLSVKNAPLDDDTRRAIVHASGLIRANGATPGRAEFPRADGGRGTVTREVDMIEDEPVPTDAPLVTQVSRWDPLKDPVGVMSAFAERARSHDDGAHLVLAGPAADGVGDDPEGAKTLDEVRQAWQDLDAPARRRIHLASLPMEDQEENAAIVNALQRSADIVVQKSLVEGFGLTVAEAMWKSRPVIASRVGGIQDQIVDGENGILVDPTDFHRFQEAITELLDDRHEAEQLGAAAHQQVCDHFLPANHFEDERELLDRILT